MALHLDGLMVAQVTPFTPGGAAPDTDWLPAHLRFLEDAGVASILTLGTNGEGPSVGLEERKRVVETVVAHKGSMDVVTGAGCVALTDTIRAANDALDAGTDALALLPPYFYSEADDIGLVDYYSSVLGALPADAKVLLYNIPSRTHLDLPDAVVLALLELHGDQVIGIKDSSGDSARTQRYLELAEPERFAVLAGADDCHAELYALGCPGGVSGIANAVPALVQAILHAHHHGEDTQRAQRQVHAVKALLDDLPALGALKQITAIITGLPCPATRPPNRDLTASETATLEERLAAYLRSDTA